jgi:hypothetical protein
VFQAVQTAAMSGVTVYDMNDDVIEYESNEDDMGDAIMNEDEDVFDPICAFCDNGGEIVWYALF